MIFLRPLVLLLILTAFSVNAQDFGPVKIDLEGYIDDRKGEMIEVEAPVKEVPKEEVVKKVEPEKEETTTRRRVVAETNTDTGPKEPIRKVSLDNFSTKSQSSSMTLYIIIGGAVVLLVIVVLAIVMLKKKKASMAPRKRAVSATGNTNVSLGDKINAHEQAVAAETTEDAQPVMNQLNAAQREVESAAQDMADQFAKETAIDERGQNASGLIIDEDKYFEGTDQFVDEDFSDLDGPHGIQNAPGQNTPQLPPG